MMLFVDHSLVAKDNRSRLWISPFLANIIRVHELRSRAGKDIGKEEEQEEQKGAPRLAQLTMPNWPGPDDPSLLNLNHLRQPRLP
jgi:hypothetical protein